MIPTKIRAVREDPKNPMLDCYANTIAANHKPSNKENTSMSFSRQSPADSDFISASNSTGKLPAVGIGSVRGAMMIRTLSRLGLIQSSEEVESLAASGIDLKRMITRPFSIYRVDQALNRTDATTEARMQFKASLKELGLIELTHRH